MAAHQSLYRKHRPQAFGELVGQEHVSVALRNAVREGRVGHAYLFSGPRGTGKTTTARLLAKALNCLDLGADGEPCCRCENCVAVAGGRFPDLFELDAASNNRVDDIRELNDRVHLGMGASSKRKVYIVDEVHELTDRAANAFLKTLEEPPEHVVFVLATTNPEKVLPTIRSRTQHYDFTLLTTEQLVGHLAEVLGREGVEAEPEALAVVARRAGGSARDALSLLDQALAHGTGRLDTEQVLALFGGTPFELRCAVLDAVAGEDPAGALVALGALVEAGHDPRRVAEDLLRSLRDAFLLEAARGRVVPEGPPEERARLEALAGTLGRGAVVRGLETLGQAVVDMRGADAADPQLVLEVALVRMARRDAGTSLDALTDRVERLERALAGRSGDAPPAPGPPSRRPRPRGPKALRPSPGRRPGPAPGARGAAPERPGNSRTAARDDPTRRSRAHPGVPGSRPPPVPGPRPSTSTT
ncbi:MAG: DNA polymerase III subunit gamma/tau [Acidimicrobiia bacterium]|nr:DNA polymerase III subunit gamma/tau [Acidimicrobiia bacterium]